MFYFFEENELLPSYLSLDTQITHFDLDWQKDLNQSYLVIFPSPQNVLTPFSHIKSIFILLKTKKGATKEIYLGILRQFCPTFSQASLADLFFLPREKLE